LVLLLALVATPFATAFAAPAAAQTSSSQDWPSKPIRAITTTSAGGLSDIFLRALGEELRTRFGQPVIVENRPGGGMNIGTRACAEAPPDGYTICVLHTESLTYNLFLYANPGYDPDKQLQPVSNLFYMTQAVLVGTSVNAKSMNDLVAASKAKPGTLSYSTASPAMMLYMESLKKEKGADWVRVPFKGGGDAINGILSGTTPVSIVGIGNALGQIQAGQIVPIAIGNPVRSPLFPDVPTITEIGYPGVPSTDWYGLFVPAGTPRDIVDKLSAAVKAIEADKTFSDKNIIQRGLVPAANTPEQFADDIKKQREQAQQVVKEADLPMR
jgi:tripartite-type tricarboxylate transporter receptor subunit TctC